MFLALVAALGATGAVVRVIVNRSMAPLIGTLAVNLAAAFLLGLTASWTGVLADGIRIGLLGAASTWSTLANEMAMLLRSGRVARAAVYIVVSLALGVASAWLGLLVAF